VEKPAPDGKHQKKTVKKGNEFSGFLREEQIDGFFVPPILHHFIVKD
jgi:hypothetical protein